jgi:hypothetical protein
MRRAKVHPATPLEHPTEATHAIHRPSGLSELDSLVPRRNLRARRRSRQSSHGVQGASTATTLACTPSYGLWPSECRRVPKSYVARVIAGTPAKAGPIGEAFSSSEQILVARLRRPSNSRSVRRCRTDFELMGGTARNVRTSSVLFPKPGTQTTNASAGKALTGVSVGHGTRDHRIAYNQAPCRRNDGNMQIRLLPPQ